jgi:predicted dehydrogenase
MTRGLNVGVIGLGMMGERHALIYDKMPLVNLKSICDSNGDRLEAFARKVKTETYAGYEEMLADPELDAVSICMPDNMHQSVVNCAVKYNKHILLEKPIASDLKAGKEIYELVKDKTKVFMVGHILRFDPRFSEAKKYVDEGEIGEIINLYCRRNSPIAGPLHYVGFTDLSMHVMIHDVDAVNWLVDSKPVKVFAKSRQVLLKKYNMTDSIFALIEYANGALACLEACWVLPENSPASIDDKVEIVGTNGALYIDSCDRGINLVSNRKISYPDSRHWPEINGEPGGALYEELTGFINCIVKNRKPIIGACEAVGALEVVDAIERSIQSGREILLG